MKLIKKGNIALFFSDDAACWIKYLPKDAGMGRSPASGHTCQIEKLSGGKHFPAIDSGNLEIELEWRASSSSKGRRYGR